MADTKQISRRQFFASSIAVAALSSPPARQVLADPKNAPAWLAGDSLPVSALANRNPLAFDPSTGDKIRNRIIRQETNYPLSDVALQPGPDSANRFHPESRGALLGGILTAHHTGVTRENRASPNLLYQRYSGTPPQTRPVPLAFIPCYAWAARQSSAMQVWTPLFKV